MCVIIDLRQAMDRLSFAKSVNVSRPKPRKGTKREERAKEKEEKEEKQWR